MLAQQAEVSQSPEPRNKELRTYSPCLGQEMLPRASASEREVKISHDHGGEGGGASSGISAFLQEHFCSLQRRHTSTNLIIRYMR